MEAAEAEEVVVSMVEGVGISKDVALGGEAEEEEAGVALLLLLLILGKIDGDLLPRPITAMAIIIVIIIIRVIK